MFHYPPKPVGNRHKQSTETWDSDLQTVSHFLFSSNLLLQIAFSDSQIDQMDCY